MSSTIAGTASDATPAAGRSTRSAAQAAREKFARRDASDTDNSEDEDDVPAEKKAKMHSQAEASIAAQDARDKDAAISDEDEDEDDDEDEDAGNDEDDSGSDFTDVDTDAEEDGGGPGSGQRRRPPSPEEREAFEQLKRELQLPTTEELRQLRKSLLHVHKLISAGQKDPGAMLRDGYNRFLSGHGLAPARVAPLLTAAQAIASDVEVPSQALENAFGPLSEFSGGRLVTAARHVDTFYALAILSLMVERQQTVDARTSSDAQHMMSEILQQRGLGGDAAHLLSMNFADEHDPFASAKTAGQALARDINALEPKERMRQLFFNLAQFVPAGTGAAAAAAANHTRRDRGCNLLYDASPIRAPAAHALSIGMQAVAVSLVVPDAHRMTDPERRALCLQEPFQRALDDAAQAQGLVGDFGTGKMVYAPFEADMTADLWKRADHWLSLCKVAYAVGHVNPAPDPTDPNYQTDHADAEPRELTRTLKALLDSGNFGTVREKLLDSYGSDAGALLPTGTLVYLNATTERASLKGEGVPEHPDFNVNRLTMRRAPCQAVGKRGYRDRKCADIFNMNGEAPTRVLETDQHTTAEEIVGLFLRSQLAFSRGMISITLLPPFNYAALGVKPRVTQMPKLRIAHRDVELRVMTRGAFAEEAVAEMRQEDPPVLIGARPTKAQKASLKKRIDKKREEYERDYPADSYAIDTRGLVNLKELPKWKLAATGWYDTVPIGRLGARQKRELDESDRVNNAFKKRASEHRAGLASVDAEKDIAPGGRLMQAARESFAANAASMDSTA
jgi:hypothetical protein